MNKKMVLIISAIVVAVIVMAVFMVQGTANSAISHEEQIKSAQSDIKVQEKRRVDLIYNLVDTVKQYSEYEYNTLTDVIKERGTNDDSSIEDVQTMINATAEAYPDLKADETYTQLMNELSMTENLIAQYRSNYNEQVKTYNRFVKKFPNRQFLSLAGYDVTNYDYLDYDVSDDAPTNLFS